MHVLGHVHDIAADDRKIVYTSGFWLPVGHLFGISLPRCRRTSTSSGSDARKLEKNVRWNSGISLSSLERNPSTPLKVGQLLGTVPWPRFCRFRALQVSMNKYCSHFLNLFRYYKSLPFQNVIRIHLILDLSIHSYGS